MADVARRVGVHSATVSRALRDDPRITLAVRERVRRAAADLGYRTNPLVAALMTSRRTRRPPSYQAPLACLTKYPPERKGGFARDFGGIVAGARKRAAARGFSLDEINVYDPNLTRARLTEILCSRGIQGLLVPPLHSVYEAIDLDWSRFCTVAFGYSLQGVAVSRVAHDNFTAYGMAASRARAAGWQRIGLVLQRRVHEKVQKHWLASDLLDHFEHPARHRVPPLLCDILDERAFRRWYHDHRPEVVIGVHVPAIVGWLAGMSLAVPNDVCVVSLDRRPADIDVAGIDQDYVGMGASAADLLIDAIQRNERGLRDKPVTVLTNGVWIDGRTLRRKGGVADGSAQSVQSRVNKRTR